MTASWRAWPWPKYWGGLHPDWTRVEAANADEALAALEGQQPDLVVLGGVDEFDQAKACGEAYD
jgi:hypothetical protein